MAQQFQPPRDFSREAAPPPTTSRLVVGLGGELAANVQAAAEDDLNAGATVAAEALSAIAGMALRTEQLASGGNVVVTVDIAALVEKLGNELGGLEGIRAVYRLDRLTRPEPDRLDFLLEIEPGADERVAAEIETLHLGTIELFGDPPRGQVSIDLATLVDEAQDRLEAEPSVLFVERERLLQPH